MTRSPSAGLSHRSRLRLCKGPRDSRAPRKSWQVAHVGPGPCHAPQLSRPATNPGHESQLLRTRLREANAATASPLMSAKTEEQERPESSRSSVRRLPDPEPASVFGDGVIRRGRVRASGSRGPVGSRCRVPHAGEAASRRGGGMFTGVTRLNQRFRV